MPDRAGSIRLVLGVVEHRIPTTATQDPKATSGYVHKESVKGLAAAAAFELVEASEINANPANTADHPFGVWTLPPKQRDIEPRRIDHRGL